MGSQPIKRTGGFGTGSRSLMSASVLNGNTPTRNMKSVKSEKSSSRTREALEHITSCWNRRAWWIFSFIVVFIILMDVNDRTDGSIAAMCIWAVRIIVGLFVWFHNDVMREWQIIGVTMGMLLGRYLFRSGGWKSYGRG